MLQLKVFILKLFLIKSINVEQKHKATSLHPLERKEDPTNLFAVNGLSTGSITPRKVTALQHETFNAPVEAGPGVGELDTGFVGLVSNTEVLKVVDSLQKPNSQYLRGIHDS